VPEPSFGRFPAPGVVPPESGVSRFKGRSGGSGYVSASRPIHLMPVAAGGCAGCPDSDGFGALTPELLKRTAGFREPQVWWKHPPERNRGRENRGKTEKKSPEKEQEQGAGENPGETKSKTGAFRVQNSGTRFLRRRSHGKWQHFPGYLVDVIQLAALKTLCHPLSGMAMIPNEQPSTGKNPTGKNPTAVRNSEAVGGWGD